MYKAEDQRLQRVVALKVVREFDSAPSRRRFWQEARAAAQVAHPNACWIYDVAEEQDRLVLVMARRSASLSPSIHSMTRKSVPSCEPTSKREQILG